MSSREFTTRSKPDDTKAQLKRAAQALFARNGAAAVTVQQIVQAAGQRNNAALHYHFGTKEGLIRQLLVEGAQQLDDRRQEMLASLDRVGGPSSVRQVLEILVLPVVELEQDPRRCGYIRLVANVQMTDRDLLRSALANRWNAGYVRCLAHLTRLVGAVPAPLLEQRLTFFGIYSNAVLSAREAALEAQTTTPHRVWSRPYTVDNFIDTLEALVTCPPSEVTLTRLRSSGRADENSRSDQRVGERGGGALLG